MANKAQCENCINCKKITEQYVDCLFDNQHIIFDNHNCAAQEWKQGSSVQIKNLVKVINNVENVLLDIKQGEYYRNILIKLRNNKKQSNQSQLT